MAYSNLPYGFKRTTNAPVDGYYNDLTTGTHYLSTADANAKIPSTIRYIGQQVHIQSDIYWYRDGIADTDLRRVVDGSIAPNSLLGRYSTTNGGMQPITIGSGLNLDTVTGILSTTDAGGTVTSVSVVSNQGVSGSVANSTTTPAITLSLGALTGITSAAITGALSAGGTVTFGGLAGVGDRLTYVNSSGAFSPVSLGAGLAFSGGVLSATGGAAGSVTYSGTTTAGYLPVWTSVSDLTNSIISVAGTVVNIPGSISGVTSYNGLVVTANTGVITTGTWNGTAIANAYLANSSITINGSSVSLGGSITVTATASNALTIGTDLSGTSYNGSTPVTINNTSTLSSVTGRGNTSSTGISLTENGNLSSSFALYMKRNTDTSPLGYFIQAQNNAANTNLFTVDVTGAVTALSFAGSGASLTSIPNSALVNSSITINGSSVSLGGSVTVSATASNALTIGTDLSGTSYNGSTPVTINNTSTLSSVTGRGSTTSTALTFNGGFGSTTGSFSGNITMTGTDSRIIGGDSAGRLLLSNSGVSTYAVMYGATGAAPYGFVVVTNSTQALIINSSQQATFASSVTAGGFNLTGGRSTSYALNYSDFRMYNTSGNLLAINNYTSDVFTLNSSGNGVFSGTVTATSFSGSGAGLTSIPNGALVNSSITINGSSVSLGGSVTVTATASNALTIGTDLSGTSYNGSTAVTINNTSTLATVTGRGNVTTNDITGGRLFSTQTNALVQAYDSSGTSATLRAYSGTNYWDFAVKTTSNLSIDYIGVNKVTIDNTGAISCGSINSNSSLTNSGIVNIGGGTTGVTTGDIYIDPTSAAPKVYIGRQSSTPNDNTTLIIRNRIGTQTGSWASADGSLTLAGIANIQSTLPTEDFTFLSNTAYKHSIIGDGYSSTPNLNTLTFKIANAASSQVTALILKGDGSLTTGAINGTIGTFSSSLNVAASGALLNLNGTGTGNSGAAVQLLGWASANKNWQVSTAYITSGLEFTPSTANGGSTFTSPVITFSETGSITASGSISGTTGTFTVSSGVNLQLNKATGAAISLVKSNSVAQEWQIAGEDNFKIYDATASNIVPFQITKGTGAATFLSSVNMGALSASTGSFSGNITMTGSDSRIIGGDSAGRLLLSNSGVSTYAVMYGATGAAPYGFVVVTNSTQALIINSSQQATFASSVTAGGFNLTGGRSTSYALNYSDFRMYNTSGNLLAINNYTSDVFTLNSSGNGVFSGTVTATGGGFDSDLTLKDIITRDISNRRIADQVSVIKYKWKDITKGIGEKFGYGAQELLNLIPEAVYKNGDTYAVDYCMVHTILIDENTKRIQALEKEVKYLKDKLAAA